MTYVVYVVIEHSWHTHKHKHTHSRAMHTHTQKTTHVQDRNHTCDELYCD